MHPTVDYDTIASTYDRRYLHNDYSGIEEATIAFVGRNPDFEPALAIDRRRYPASSQIQQWMHTVDFVDCVTREVQHMPGRLSARAALEQGRLDQSATSQLSVLTNEQYQQGIDRIRKGIESAEARGGALYLTAALRVYATFGSVPSS
ncbi:MAG: hypothetical protein LC804_05360 [Acidobacteria bacterium]|nr:hypothetical protein [Acidobacteriota bacterium]